jgi:tetratricopeptide (TPR) repeat protein
VIECCSKLLKNESLSEELKAEITFRLANAQCKSDRMQEAVELLSKSVNSLPSDSPWKLPSLLLLAETSFQIEKLPLSRKTFSKLVEDSKMSQSAEIRYLATLRLGEIAAIENDWLLADQFASGLRQATDCFTYEAATNYLFGRISVTKGEFDEARSQLSQAVKSAGKETEIAARAQWLIGETYFLQNNYSMALQNYAAVLHYDDQPQWCAVSQLQAAKCLEAQGNWTDAVAAYQRAIEAYPDSIYVDETLQRLQTAQKSAATHIAEVESKNTR